jgi:hypothetical protein
LRWSPKALQRRIARKLIVTVAAVERHVTSIFDKLGLRKSSKSVSSRKFYVEEYSVGVRLGYGGKCFVTVRGLFDELETACGEQFSRRSAELLAVVNNQDPVGHLTHSW